MLLLALSATETHAQMASTSPLPEAHSPGEEQALELLGQGLMVSARSSAESVLAVNPSSIVGHYVLGRALFDAEGSLARAMFHLGRARELYETTEMRSGVGSAFHQELLYQIARLAGDMELYQYQLDILGFYDSMYDPDLVAERCWPLMKLGRQDEARRFADVAVHSPNAWQRAAGYNALCALEGEARTRQPYHAACLQALEDARQRTAQPHTDEHEQPGLAVDAYNAALAAASALQFEEAEQEALEGTHRFEPTGADPWQLLVELYISEGRMNDALDAFGNMVRWNVRMPAAMRDQGRAEIEASVAMMLLHAGATSTALERIDRALARPDRRGLTTDGAEQARGRHALMRRMIRRTLEQERAEQASWNGRSAQAWNAVSWAPRSLGAWPDDERIIAVLTDDERLVASIRPYVAGGLAELSPWLAGELVDVLGPAIVSVALRRAREVDQADQGTSPFYDALEAEIAAARGDDPTCVSIATRTLPRLEEQHGWALVRARLGAIAGHAAEHAGMPESARDFYATAMEVDPGVMRRLGYSLPVSITSTGGESDEAADLLARSPRFHSQSGFFELAVAQAPNGLRACLRTADGNELRCAEVQRPSEHPTDQERATEAAQDPALRELTLAQLLAREVHRQLWSARIDASRIDMGSLDGRPTGTSSLASEHLREMMEGDGTTPPP